MQQSQHLFFHQRGLQHVPSLAQSGVPTLTPQQQVQPPMHPTHHVAMPMAFPETSMPDAVEVNPNSWMNACHGSAADVNTLGLQRFAPIPQDVYYSGGNLWQQQPLQCENTQALIASRYASGANGIAALMALGISGDTISDSRTITISWKHTGAWAQAQVLATDQIRDPWVHSFTGLFLLIED